MKSFSKIPAVVNPTRWVKKGQCHAAMLYDNSAYDKDVLSSNPFARALEVTNNENTLMRFPRRDLVRMTAETDILKLGETPKSKVFKLLPIINEELSLDKFYFASSYILNNKSFIDGTITRKKVARRYVPRKIVYKLTGKYDAHFVPGFSDHIEIRYRQNIEDLLRTRDKIQDENAPSMIITNQGPPISIQGGNTVINLYAFAKSISLDDPLPIILNYDKNIMLCDQILCFLQYTQDHTDEKTNKGATAK